MQVFTCSLMAQTVSFVQKIAHVDVDSPYTFWSASRYAPFFRWQKKQIDLQKLVRIRRFLDGFEIKECLILYTKVAMKLIWLQTKLNSFIDMICQGNTIVLALAIYHSRFFCWSSSSLVSVVLLIQNFDSVSMASPNFCLYPETVSCWSLKYMQWFCPDMFLAESVFFVRGMEQESPRWAANQFHL